MKCVTAPTWETLWEVSYVLPRPALDTHCSVPPKTLKPFFHAPVSQAVRLPRKCQGLFVLFTAASAGSKAVPG